MRNHPLNAFIASALNKLADLAYLKSVWRRVKPWAHLLNTADTNKLQILIADIERA